MTRNNYIAEYKGNKYPTLALAAEAAGVKRYTLNKAVMKLVKQGLNNFQVECCGETFRVTQFN